MNYYLKGYLITDTGISSVFKLTNEFGLSIVSSCGSPNDFTISNINYVITVDTVRPIAFGDFTNDVIGCTFTYELFA